MFQTNEAEFQFELLISSIWARQKSADSQKTSADVSAINSPYHVSSLHTLQADPNEFCSRTASIVLSVSRRAGRPEFNSQQELSLFSISSRTVLGPTHSPTMKWGFLCGVRRQERFVAHLHLELRPMKIHLHSSIRLQSVVFNWLTQGQFQCFTLCFMLFYCCHNWDHLL
jgi:hypothetical protein